MPDAGLRRDEFKSRGGGGRGGCSEPFQTRRRISLCTSYRAPLFVARGAKSPTELPASQACESAAQRDEAARFPQQLRDRVFQTEFLTQVTSQLSSCAAWAELEALEPTSPLGPERWHGQRRRAHPSRCVPLSRGAEAAKSLPKFAALQARERKRGHGGRFIFVLRGSFQDSRLGAQQFPQQAFPAFLERQWMNEILPE